jgi:adenylylsulfate kinase
MPLCKPLSVWFIGLPCSGKSTISQGIHPLLVREGIRSRVLDGDILRQGINNNLGFTMTDRYENIRRVAEINKLFLEENYLVLNALICPLEEMRDLIREIVGREHYLEIFVDAPLDVCEKRDIKGMYQKARAGEIEQFTGVNSPFEPPVHPDLIVKTDLMSVQASVEKAFRYLQSKIMSN